MTTLRKLQALLVFSSLALAAPAVAQPRPSSSSQATLAELITGLRGARAIAATSSEDRQALIQGALNDLRKAKTKFGTKLGFNLGEGNTTRMASCP